MPAPRRRLDEIGAGLGPASIPYSRVQGEDAMPMLDPQRQQEALAMLQGNQGAPDEELDQGAPDMGAPPMGAPDMGAGPADPTTDQLSDQDLETMAGGGAPAGGQDPAIAQVLQALEDPNTPPEVRQRIETMISLAARRRMAGINA